MSALLLAYHHGPGHDGWFPYFPLLPLVFFGLWVAMFVVIARRRGPWNRGGGESVLAERYARGEIDEAEYRQRRAVLRGKS